ncbi:MAG: glycyl-radical enzyme activating protein [Verrucomicrobiota bacterium]
MSQTGLVFNIQKYSLHDGPGIRSTVFLKGCPLRCLWCHNPEGISPQREIVIQTGRCLDCGECRAACPQPMATRGEGCLPARDESCTLCGSCVDACPTAARQRLGDRMAVAEVMASVLKDRVFYDESDGGVTISGGEPLSQPQFLLALLAACRREGLHTVLDTTGCGQTGHLLAAAELTDLVLYDLKALDEGRHLQLTGVSNTLILDNLKRLDRVHRNIWIRLPVVPGLNDDLHNLTQIAEFVLGLRHVTLVNLLPFHRTGLDKFARLGQTHTLAGVQAPSVELMEAAVRIFHDAGLQATIGG